MTTGEKVLAGVLVAGVLYVGYNAYSASQQAATNAANPLPVGSQSNPSNTDLFSAGLRGFVAGLGDIFRSESARNSRSDNRGSSQAPTGNTPITGNQPLVTWGTPTPYTGRS